MPGRTGALAHKEARPTSRVAIRPRRPITSECHAAGTVYVKSSYSPTGVEGSRSVTGQTNFMVVVPTSARDAHYGTTGLSGWVDRHPRRNEGSPC